MKHGINKENLDLQSNPKEDFYQFACGGWMKNNPLTDEYSSFGAFEKIRENTREQIKELILNLSEDPEALKRGTVEQKIKDIYALGMDEERLNHEKALPLKKDIEKIENFNGKAATGEEFIDLLAWLHKGIDGAFIPTGVGPHPQNSDLYILHVGEAGLGLGDRDYYLVESEENTRIMNAYKKYVKRLMELIGKNPEEQQRIWKNVIEIERKIAENKLTREQRRDPMLRFNLYNRTSLKKEYKNFDWDYYFEKMEIEPDEINVLSKNFLKFIIEYLPTLPTQSLKDYLLYSIVSNSSGLLSDDFTEADFEMFNKTMSGQKELKPRWKRVMGVPNSMLGEAIGEIYVKKYFPPEAKEYMLGLVENLKKGLRERIENLEWMSEDTKEKAKNKLDKMTVKIGYPDKWKDYSGLEIDPELSFNENLRRASIWFTKDNYSKLSKPVDKEEWHMTPQTVNAYYSPVSNEICFPAAILQPPFFDFNADDALNYGGIGVVIGHEMTHGFDDQGRQYDENGNLSNWWTEEDAEKFKAHTKVLVDQFNEVEVAEGIKANGEYTLGENIADQGGLLVALRAYSSIGSPKEIIDGLTPLQRFFLSYGGVWANNITNEEILRRTTTDPHSLGKNRVNVTLKNIDEFFEAFDIKDGDAMFRPKEERITIW